MKKENLHSIKSPGFKIPNQYFDSFEADFFERLNEKEFISASEKSSFTVPKNYFDSVETNILEKLNKKPETPVISLKSRRTFYYVAGIAASFILMFSLVFNNDNITIDNIDTASIETYLYQEDYSGEDLATLFNNDELSVSDFIDYNISEETIDQYIEELDIEELNFD